MKTSSGLALRYASVFGGLFLVAKRPVQWNRARAVALVEYSLTPFDADGLRPGVGEGVVGLGLVVQLADRRADHEAVCPGAVVADDDGVDALGAMHVTQSARN